MSLSGAHRAAFRREVPQDGSVFTIRDKRGYPIPKDPDGCRAVPFWSKASRARKVIDQVSAYRRFEVVAIDVADWRERWLPGLHREGHLVGINWSGTRATGYDMTPAEVMRWFAGS